MDISGSVGLITGGASGLGLGAVRMLVEEGGRAAILDVPGSAGERLVGELGDSVAFFATDVTDTENVERSVNAACEHFGKIDVCINCAGIGTPSRVVARDGTPFPMEIYRRVVEVNLIGLFDVTRRAAVCMSRNEPGVDDERGLIINVASIAGLEGQVGQAAYAGSKGGVIASTLPLARDLAQWGIRVLTIAPGIMDTAMLAGVTDELRQAVTDLSVFPKRLGTPEDFALLVASLMRNRMINGDVIRLDAATRLPPR